MFTKTQVWLNSIRKGDLVGVYDYKGSIYRQPEQVIKITPTGRIVCPSGTYKPDGYLIGSSSDRCLRPIK